MRTVKYVINGIAETTSYKEMMAYKKAHPNASIKTVLVEAPELNREPQTARCKKNDEKRLALFWQSHTR